MNTTQEVIVKDYYKEPVYGMIFKKGEVYTSVISVEEHKMLNFTTVSYIIYLKNGKLIISEDIYKKVFSTVKELRKSKINKLNKLSWTN